MKYKIYIIFIAVLFAACRQKEKGSDAFGNFETETIIISSESSGKILKLNIEKGQQLNTGEIAALIDTTQIFLKIRQLESQIAAVQSKKQTVSAQINVFKEQKKNLKVNLQRIENMLKDGAATQKQFDDIEGQINVIDTQIASTKTQFSSLEKELEVFRVQKETILDQLRRCKITSPANGTVLETYAEQGELATPGKPLLKMADLSELNLKVYVSGDQLPKVKLGQNVEVLVDKSETENQSFKGKVTWISSEAEFTPKIIQTKEERVKLVYAVKIKVKNNGTIKIGMPGEVVF